MTYIVGNWDGEGQNRPGRFDEFRAKPASRRTVGLYEVYYISGDGFGKEYRVKATVHAVNPKEPDSMLLFVRRDVSLSYVRVNVRGVGLEKGEIASRVMKDFGVRELSDLIGKTFDLNTQGRIIMLTPLPDEPEQHAAQPEEFRRSWQLY